MIIALLLFGKSVLQKHDLTVYLGLHKKLLGYFSQRFYPKMLNVYYNILRN